MHDHATEYARMVVAGEVVAGKPHILACKRHLRDLERQDTDEFPYIWKPEKSERILEYSETLTIIEGEEPQPVKLRPFQFFDIGVPFGWYNRKDKRRFRRAYKSMAKQNGKTFVNGIMASYVAAFGGYKYGKLFTVATKHPQAKLAWDEVNKFIAADPELAALFSVKEYKTVIESIFTKCTIEALSKERSLDEGARSIFSSVDEIHQHKDNSIYKAIYNGTRGLMETLVSMVTTRGRSMNSFCYEMDTYAMNILNGTVIAEDMFVDIYCLDPTDDYFDEKVWIKANPLLCSTEWGMEIMRADARTARDMGGQDLVDFIVKCLNLWPYKTDSQYIDIDKWNGTAVDMGLEAMQGRSCYAGLDLSSGGNLTTLSLDFDITDMEAELPIKIPPTQGDTPLPISYIYSHSFMPKGRLDEHIQSDLAPYDQWANEGLITITGGESDYKNDYKFILKHLRDIQEEYNLKFLGIGYDPHNADVFLSDLEEFGCPLLEIKQSARYLNEATEDLRLEVKSSRTLHDSKNSLLTWSMANAKTTKNSFGEVKIDKEPYAKTKRIDPVDAAIDARTMRIKMPEEINTAEALENYLEKRGWK